MNIIGLNRKKIARGNHWPYIFILPFIGLYFIFNLFPVIYSFGISLTNWSGTEVVKYVGFKNYIDIITKDAYFFKSIFNTVIILLMSTPVVIILGLMFAEVIFKIGQGRRLFETVNFLPYITTPVAIGFLFSFLFDWQTGVINNVLLKLGFVQEGINWLGDARYTRFVVAAMIIWKFTGYHMTVYLAGMSALPHDIYEAAKVDGSTSFNTFFKITLPLLKPITTFLVITNIIGGLQMFDEPSLLFTASTQGGAAGGPGRAALTAVWHFYDVTFKSSSRLGYGAAVSYSLFMIILVFTILGYKVFNKKEEEK